MKRERIGIKWKIFGYLLGFAGMLLIILWLFQTVYLSIFYKQIKRNELSNAMDELESFFDHSDFDVMADAIAKSYDISVIVTDLQGKLLYSSGEVFADLNGYWNPEQVKEWGYLAMENGGDYLVEEIFSPKKEIFRQNTEEKKLPPEKPMIFPKEDLAMLQREEFQRHMDGFPKRYDQEHVTWIRLEEADSQSLLIASSIITPVDATVHTLKIQLIYISALMVALSMLIAWRISKNISRSIIRVNHSAKELAKGNYQVAFDAKDYREIAELSETLNYATKELAKTENFQRELIANVSHDLRTPLTMIIAYAEVMRDLPEENTPENVQVVIDEAERLTALVNDMLDLSKLQAKVMTLECKNYDLTDSVHSVIDRFSKLTSQDGYEISFEYKEHLFVEADEEKIEQVIYNLINNAIHYTGEDRKVKLFQTRLENWARIEVADDGEGMAEDILPYVWERYYKVDKTHRRAVKGSGLGLSIVKNIIGLHNGKCGVKSEPGKGSIFWFELKICDEKTTRNEKFW